MRIRHARLAEIGERVGDLLVHLDGEAVQPVGAVEGEAGDAAFDLERDGFVSHGAPMTPNELADKVARSMLAAEGTGPAWGIEIEEAREGYARIRMTLRADMLNGHGIAHGGIVFALADTAFAYVCNGRNLRSVAAQASIVFLDQAKEGEVLIAEAPRAGACRPLGRHPCQRPHRGRPRGRRIHRLFAQPRRRADRSPRHPGLDRGPSSHRGVRNGCRIKSGMTE